MSHFEFNPQERNFPIYGAAERSYPVEEPIDYRLWIVELIYVYSIGKEMILNEEVDQKVFRTAYRQWVAAKNEQAFISGVSSGIASHLAIDATIDGGGTYKDRPVPLPMIGHQTIMGVNAVTEMIDSFRKSLRDPLDLVCSSLEKDLEEETTEIIQDANVNYVENIPLTVHYQKGLYRGETLNELPHGQGVFISMVKKKKEGKVKYREAKLDGEFRQGIFLGKALIKYENGASYEGHIEGDLKCHGFGIIRYPLGAKYIGNIIDAKREGYGIYHEPDGISKVGVWEADKAKRVEEWIDGSKAA